MPQRRGQQRAIIPDDQGPGQAVEDLVLLTPGMKPELDELGDPDMPAIPGMSCMFWLFGPVQVVPMAWLWYQNVPSG
ncbi:hypothetical protein ACFYTG_50435 [Streptomyces mirabilis]|uniref:hypothetical protein n=1 Tax=Streptomyces mirabilis TaxID=68239 RepID=UPI003686F30A